MNNILKYITENFEAGGFAASILFAMVVLMFNVKKMLNFFEEQRKVKLLRLSSALKLESMDPETRFFFESQLLTEHFRVATGLRLDPKHRLSYIRTYNRLNGDVTFSQLKKSRNYLIPSPDGSDLKANVGITDKIGLVFNVLFWLILSMLGALMVVQPTHVDNTTLYQSLSAIGIGLTLIAIGFFALYQGVPVLMAMKVDRHLKRLSDSEVKPRLRVKVKT